MAVLDSVTEQTPQHPPLRGMHPWLALGLALLCPTTYVVALLVPYYANDLHRRPAGETLYLHDLSGLWPHTTALSGVVSLLTLLAVALGPFVAVGVALWAARNVWSHRHITRQMLTWLPALAVSIAALCWIFTPLASELFIWLID